MMLVKGEGILKPRPILKGRGEPVGEETGNIPDALSLLPPVEGGAAAAGAGGENTGKGGVKSAGPQGGLAAPGMTGDIDPPGIDGGEPGKDGTGEAGRGGPGAEGAPGGILRKGHPGHGAHDPPAGLTGIVGLYVTDMERGGGIACPQQFPHGEKGVVPETVYVMKAGGAVIQKEYAGGVFPAGGQENAEGEAIDPTAGGTGEAQTDGRTAAAGAGGAGIRFLGCDRKIPQGGEAVFRTPYQPKEGLTPPGLPVRRGGTGGKTGGYDPPVIMGPHREPPLL